MDHLRAGGVSVLLEDGEIVHWGADVGADLSGLGAALTPPLARGTYDVRMPRPAAPADLELDDTGVLALRGQGLLTLPVPAAATEVLDLTGRWCRERHPQRRRFDQGTWLREQRRGRTGFDTPLLLVAGTPGFSWRSGEVWGIHLAWSGNSEWRATRPPEGPATLSAGALLEAGEEASEWPWLYAVWSDRGLDGLSARLHAFVRARPSHPRRPRPVVLNTWEAVYFDHRLDRLTSLADVAASIGVERFVLDDGWFRGRRDDTAGLGDWYVDDDVWPSGLHPLVKHVRGLGMEFGLWVEPEMVNPDSDLARAHPDWVLPGAPWRHQQGLDVVKAFDYLLERLDALVSEYAIDFLKWDHNRDRSGALHAQVLAAYRLMDELRARHPALEIETCASGGARVDLGVLAHTDRVWASDTNDALERQTIQTWTQLLLPPELVGSHVGPPRSHTTGRTHGLSFRCATALFGHFGIEWDIASASDSERAGLAEAIALYKDVRGLLHSGEVVRVDVPDPAVAVHGVVGDGEALFCIVQLATSPSQVPGTIRLPGLDPARSYAVEPLPFAAGPEFAHAEPPGWFAGATLTGRALAAAGLQLPVLAPEQALVVRLRAV
jgi:alpha-galactosidase